MAINFPQDVHARVTASGDVTFQAVIDGKAKWCVISAEALEDHFGAKGASSQEMMRAFGAHREEIEEKARQCLDVSGGHHSFLRTVDF